MAHHLLLSSAFNPPYFNKKYALFFFVNPSETLNSFRLFDFIKYSIKNIAFVEAGQPTTPRGAASTFDNRCSLSQEVPMW